MMAESRVFVLDPHFDGSGLAAIWAGLEQTQANVKILTQAKAEVDKWLTDESRKLPSGIEVRTCRHAFHDRFAVVDAELWHFGSTVGGGYHVLSAVSRGWSAHADSLAELFGAWWE